MEIKSLHAPSLVETLKEINKFIKGGEYKALKPKIAAYSYHLVEFNRDFHIITIYSDKDYRSNAPVLKSASADQEDDTPSILAELETLLTHLGIPKYRWGRYLNSNLTLYDLLCQLNADLQKIGDIQMHTIISLIDEKTSQSKKILFTGGAVFLGILSALSLTPFMQGLVELVKIVMASAMAFPILGLIYTGASALYYAYENHFDKKRSLLNRIRDNSFLFINTALNVSAYAVWIAAAAVMTPVTAILFIVAAVTDVCKELFAATQNYLEYKNHPLLIKEDLHGHQEQARRQIGYVKHRNAALINIIGAVVLLAIMIAWNFVPGGLFVTIAAVAAIAVVYGLQRMAIKSNEKIMRERLQNDLNLLEQQYENDNTEDLTKSTILDLDKTLKPELRSALVNAADVQAVDSPIETSSFSAPVDDPPNQKNKKVEAFSTNHAVASDLLFFSHLTKEDTGSATSKISLSSKLK